MILLRIAPAPICRTVIITGRQIGKVGARGWVHTAQQRRWAELLHVFLIVAGVIVGVGAASLVGLLARRWRRWHQDAARAMPPLPSKVARAAQPLPKAQPARVLPAERQRELPADVHFHLHG
jgi:hypothetical protein